MTTQSTASKKRAFFTRLRWYAIIAGTVLLAVAACALFTKTKIFFINEIEIKGVPEELALTIKRDLTLQILGIPRSALLSPMSYFAWPKDFPYRAAVVNSIKIEKKLLNREVRFFATKREGYAVWCKGENSEESCFWIDPLGVAFSKAPRTEGQLVRTIHSDQGAISIDMPILGQNEFSVLRKIIDGLKELPATIEKIEYLKELSEIHLITPLGTKIRLSTRFDPALTALPALRRLIVSPGLNALEYANLTVENRAYLKYR